jgi:hypothetical protein
MKTVFWVFLAALVVAVGGVGYVALQKNSALADSRLLATSLTQDIAGLKGNVSELQANLSDSQGKAKSLQSDLDTTRGDLDRAQGDLKSANGQIASLSTDLKSTQSANSALSQNLKKVSDPRHFQSVAELADWLAKDDTNTRYANARPSQLAYILQVRALRDGFILAANVAWDFSAGMIYSENVAVIDGTIFEIDPASDAVHNSKATFTILLPSHPEAQP